MSKQPSEIPIYFRHGRDLLGTLKLNEDGIEIVRKIGIKAIYMASMSNKGVITFDGIGGPPIKQGGLRGPRKEEFTKKYITNRKDKIINLKEFEDND